LIQCELDLIKTLAEWFYDGGLVVDVGSSDAAFRSRSKFSYNLERIFGPTVQYFDIKETEGVTIVGDAEKLAGYFQPESVAFVICTNLLEHVLHPWVVPAQVARVLKPKGMAVFSAPWVYAEHPDPLDCWRMSEDGMMALVEPYFEQRHFARLKQPDATIIFYAGQRREFLPWQYFGSSN
jgi:SAM-dependent methyltransferase